MLLKVNMLLIDHAKAAIEGFNSMMASRFVWVISVMAFASCSGDPLSDAQTDAGIIPSVDHCIYKPLLRPTTSSLLPQKRWKVNAGAQEKPLGAPLGVTMAGYTGKLMGEGRVDDRTSKLAGRFTPTIGLESIPKVKAVSFTFTDPSEAVPQQKMVWLKLDLAYAYHGYVRAVEEALGSEYYGHVIVSTSHTHAGIGNFSGDMSLGMGGSLYQKLVVDRISAAMIDVAKGAIANEVPAQIGITQSRGFDPEHRVIADRRPENDHLPGGEAVDDHLGVLRVDALTGEPLAMMVFFGVHGTIHGGANTLLSGDAPGGVERVLEERFDEPVVVMHIQGSAGDASPVGLEAVPCNGKVVCGAWSTVEAVGQMAAHEIMSMYEGMESRMQSQVAFSMRTEAIDLGPRFTNFNTRSGKHYAPFVPDRVPDRMITDANGAWINAVDEFNAPYGSTLCGIFNGDGSPGSPLVGTAAMPGVYGLGAYSSCSRIEELTGVVGALIGREFKEPVICDITKTTVSVLKLNEDVFFALPYEPTAPLSHSLRQRSGVEDVHAFVVGYSQDHGGYALLPEDWVLGGYETNITFWGPLEGEMVLDKVLDIQNRMDEAQGDPGEQSFSEQPQEVPESDPAPLAGTFPVMKPTDTWPQKIILRNRLALETVQPRASIKQFESAFVTWVGEDPLVETPVVTLERADEAGVFHPVLRKSGRQVMDAELLMIWTPITSDAGDPPMHHWTVEWQAVAALGEKEINERLLPYEGRFRFHIKGAEYNLFSDPFSVVANGEMPAGTMDIERTSMGLRVGYGKGGYRLLSLDPASAVGYPLKGVATVEALNVKGEVLSIESVMFDNGATPWTAPRDAIAVRVTDTHGRLAILNL